MFFVGNCTFGEYLLAETNAIVKHGVLIENLFDFIPGYAPDSSISASRASPPPYVRVDVVPKESALGRPRSLDAGRRLMCCASTGAMHHRACRRQSAAAAAFYQSRRTPTSAHRRRPGSCGGRSGNQGSRGSGGKAVEAKAKEAVDPSSHT